MEIVVLVELRLVEVIEMETWNTKVIVFFVQEGVIVEVKVVPVQVKDVQKSNNISLIHKSEVGLTCIVRTDPSS